MDLPLFTHSPLEDPSTQIRLVHIPLLKQRLADGEMFQCIIKTVRLDSVDHAFTAVSYAWGSTAQPHQILLNSKLLNVGDNLWWFIQHVSVKERDGSLSNRDKMSRWFWIDQICIDQKRRIERNHQVQIMGDIYKNSDLVLIWLDDGKKDPQPLIFLEEYSNEGIDLIIRNSYWTRLWIIQEVILASVGLSVLFGSIARGWAMVKYRVQQRLRRQSPVLGPIECPQGLSILLDRKILPGTMTDRFALHKALEHFSAQSCLNPRDKIYGLMGIVDKKQRIDIDYQKSTQEVFWDAIAAVKEQQVKKTNWIIRLGHEMDVTGEEGSCKGQGLEKFKYIFSGRHPVDIFSMHRDMPRMDAEEITSCQLI